MIVVKRLHSWKNYLQCLLCLLLSVSKLAVSPPDDEKGAGAKTLAVTVPQESHPRLFSEDGVVAQSETAVIDEANFPPSDALQSQQQLGLQTGDSVKTDPKAHENEAALNGRGAYASHLNGLECCKSAREIQQILRRYVDFVLAG